MTKKKINKMKIEPLFWVLLAGTALMTIIAVKVTYGW